MWIVIALIGALFTSLTTIFAKVGIKNVNSNFATFFRTGVVIIFAVIMCFITNSFASFSALTTSNWLFLILSGIATGLSWLCYYRAIKLGDVSKVAPIDKSSFINCKIGRIIGKQNNKGVIQGISDIATTDPWMVDYFQGGYDEAKKYSSGSNKTIYPICPYCGRVKNKKIKINDIKKMHGISCVCNDKMSYPEKVMYLFLEYFNIPFIHRYSAKWTHDEKQKFEYDFKILKNKLCDECLIEIHGAQHYIAHGFEYKGGRTLEEEKDNDLRKKNCAYLNGYNDNSYFQINCLKSNFEYIMSNILHSEFTKNFILSNDDLEKIKKRNIFKFVRKSLFLLQKI